jgi:predicted RNA methylase
MDSGAAGPGLASGLRAGYTAAADSWAAGPERVYAPLAAALVGAATRPAAGCRVLDLGAGTGVAGRGPGFVRLSSAGLVLGVQA